MSSSTASLEINTAPVFEPLLKPARYKGAHGGRGSGKSWFFAGLMVEQAMLNPGFRAVCVREVQKDLKESAKLLIEDQISAMGVGHLFDPKHDRIVTPGDGLIIFKGMQDYTAQSVKSLEAFKTAWVEEAQTLTKFSLEMLRPTIRAPGSELWFSWNPRDRSDPVDQLLRGDNAPPGARVIEANYSDNPWFPDELEQERQFDRQAYPDRYAHIWLGDYEPVAVGAIFNRAMFSEHRRTIEDVARAVDFKRTLVSVDPAVSSEPGSNRHGIMCGALGTDNRGYLIEDASCHGEPAHWARKAITLYDKWECDGVVVEVNQGGDMVKHTLRSIRPTLPIIEVRATRGKHVRAEPISALYAQGRITHCGSFPEVEDQACKTTATGYEGDGSPDEMDAMVWLWTELFPAMVATKRRPIIQRKVPVIGNTAMG